MTFSLFGSKKDKVSSSQLDNVNINRDGIVSLNLDDESVQKQVLAQIEKLKTFEQQLKAS